MQSSTVLFKLILVLSQSISFSSGQLVITFSAHHRFWSPSIWKFQNFLENFSLMNVLFSGWIVPGTVGLNVYVCTFVKTKCKLVKC